MKFFRLPTDKVVWFLLVVSLILYYAAFRIFGHAGEIAFSFVTNVAFLPVYVLFVTLMIERVLKERERAAIIEKLNMVIGIFFSELGTPLLHDFLAFYPDGKEVSRVLRPTPHWTDQEFQKARDFLQGQNFRLDARLGDLSALKEFLAAKKDTMLMLMENPNLLEHDAFTDLLWAVFHLIQELQARKSLEGLSEVDLEHLSGDITRAHTYLLIEWVSYMQHLKKGYPYLFSLAVRMNPMDPNARAEVDG